MPNSLTPLLPPGRLACALLMLALAPGCAPFKSKPAGEDAYAQADVDELLGFGAALAGRPAAARAETCRALLGRQKQAPGPGVQLHLMMGRGLSDACGDIPKILDGLDSPALRNPSDGRVRQWIAVQAETLRRMDGLSRKIASLERKHKTVQTVLESKEHKAAKGAKASKPSGNEENRLLRDKLEAIREMEKKLDDSGDGN